MADHALSDREDQSSGTRLLAPDYLYARELFLPGAAEGMKQVVLNMLHGVNEMHHTLSNYLLRHSKDEEGDLEVLSQMLVYGANLAVDGGRTAI